MFWAPNASVAQVFAFCKGPPQSMLKHANTLTPLRIVPDITMLFSQQDWHAESLSTPLAKTTWASRFRRFRVSAFPMPVECNSLQNLRLESLEVRRRLACCWLDQPCRELESRNSVIYV